MVCYEVALRICSAGSLVLSVLCGHSSEEVVKPGPLGAHADFVDVHELTGVQVG